MSTEYRISQFDPSKASTDRVWLLIGARNGGKSVLLRDLLYHNKGKIDIAMAMTATVSTANSFSEFIPEPFIYKDGYDYNKAENFLSSTEKLVVDGKTRHAGLILDDCMFDDKVMKTPTQRKLHLNGRHYNTSIFNTTQYCMIIPNAIRTNIDYVLALKDTIKANRRRLYEYFFGSFPSFAEFDKVFQKCTENYGALVLDRTQPSGKREDMIKWYVANNNLPRFKLGRPIYFYLAEMAKRVKQQTSSKNQKRTKVIT